MKKVMLGILVLIPIIIVLVVGLVTRFVSVKTDIPVESISIDKPELSLNYSDLKVDVQTNKRIVNLNDYLTVTVMPERAKNKTVTWSITGKITSLDPDIDSSDTELAFLVDDNGYKTNTNSTGLIQINGYCTFTITVEAEGFKASCFVSVGDSDIQSVTLSGSATMSTGDKALFTAFYRPVNSIVTKGSWASDNESVAVVDANGVVTAVGEGTANITMTAIPSNPESEPVTSAPFAVRVNKGLTYFGSVVYTHEKAVSLSAVGFTGSVASVKDGAVSGDTLTILEGKSSAVITDASGATVTFVKCEENDIAIANASLLAFDDASDNPYVISSDDMPLVLSAEWLSDFKDGAPSVTWKSSDTSVVEVNANGVVTPVGNGRTATVTATAGDKSASIKLFAAKKIAVLQIQTTDESLAVGLARETVFASQRLDPNPEISIFDKEYVPNSVTIEFGSSMLPANEAELEYFYDAFIFTADKPELVSITDNVVTFVPEAIKEKTTVTITVKAKYPKYAGMTELITHHVTLNVVPGVAVGTYDELARAGKDSKNYQEVNGVNEYVEPLIENITLYADVEYGDGFNTFQPYATTIEIYCNLYGNYKRIYSTKAYMDAHNATMVCVRHSGDSPIVVSNVIVSPNNDIGDEITDLKGAQGLKGYCFAFSSRHGENEKEEFHPTDMRLEYSIMQNTNNGMNVESSDVTLKGCVVRNIGGIGLYVKTYMNDAGGVRYGKVTIHNVVMSNMIGTTMNFHYTGFSNTPEKAVKAEQAVKEGRNSSLTVKGFFDIYNWKDVNNLSLIDSSMVGEENYYLIEALMVMMESEFSKPTYSYLTARYNGMLYMHGGLMSTGITEKSYLEFNDERFAMITSDALTKIPYPIKMWCYYSNEKSVRPGQTYSITPAFIDRLHEE